MEKLNVKVGDLVLVSKRYGSGYELLKVEKVTPTGRFNAGGDTFHPDGHERGVSGYHSRFARIPTPAQLITVREENKRTRLSSAIYIFADRVVKTPQQHPVKTETLEKIVALIEADAAEAKAKP